MKKIHNLVVLLAGLLVLSTLAACSSQAWYQGFQARQRQLCLEVPSAEYTACMERANRSYENYRREREERYEK